MAIALSYSRLSTYETCPRKFDYQFLKKAFPDDSNNPAFVKGNRLHKQLENTIIAMRSGGELPEIDNICKPVVPMLRKLASTYDLFPEQKLALNSKLSKDEWFGHDVIWRAIVDALGFKTDNALALDFKSGKVREYDGFGGQLHLTAMIVFLCFPTINKVTAAYLFLEHTHTIALTFTRDELPSLVEHFTKQFDTVNNDTMFDPKSNKYCFFCPATKQQCEYK